MRYFISCLLITLISFGLFINEASAKRFGGGRSFGVQRSYSSLYSSNKTHNTSGFRQQTNSKKWGGVLGGMLMGGLLASLFMGHGFANGLISWLIVGALGLFIMNLFRQRMQPRMQASEAYASGSNAFNPFKQAFTQHHQSGSNNTAHAPLGFQEESFLREAKVIFNRLQAAYDQKNLQDLTTFTAPEVFGEIKMQLDERHDAPNRTEVITLNAALLDISKQFDSTMASVRFTGTIKENDDPITTLDEIWHFRQFGNNPQWLVGGIQQEVHQL